MTLSADSRKKLDEVHGDLRAVILRAADITTQPFEVSEGMRTLEKQKEYLRKGTTQTLNSRHLTGHAVDLMAMVNGKPDFNNREPYTPIWEAVRTAAAELGVPIEWGGNWKSFVDVFHFALPWAEYPKGVEKSYLDGGKPFNPQKFETCVAFVLDVEGGWNPDDPSTRGVTLDTLRRWDADATLDDLKALTEEKAKLIYRALFWHPIRGDDLPVGLDFAVFDFGVHSGPSVAAMFLQETVGADADGIIGPLTLAAIKKSDIEQTINTLCSKRLERMKGLSNWSKYQKGWTKRVEDVRARAVHMVATGAPADPEPPEGHTEPFNISQVPTFDLVRELMTREGIGVSLNFSHLRKEN